jgi:hypothetical protein
MDVTPAQGRKILANGKMANLCSGQGIEGNVT